MTVPTGRFAEGLRALLVGLALASATVTQAEPPPAAAAPAVGDALPVLGLRDQHSAEAPIDPSTRLVLFTRDMDGGGFVKETLAEDGSAKLAAVNAVSDVSGMPALVRSMFALPSIRKRPYRVVLDETGTTATSAMPYRQGAVTMLTLENGRIQAIDFATTLEALLTRLAPAAAP